MPEEDDTGMARRLSAEFTDWAMQYSGMKWTSEDVPASGLGYGNNTPILTDNLAPGHVFPQHKVPGTHQMHRIGRSIIVRMEVPCTHTCNTIRPPESGSEGCACLSPRPSTLESE
jgi:hypothetical protein